MLVAGGDSGSTGFEDEGLVFVVLYQTTGQHGTIPHFGVPSYEQWVSQRGQDFHAVRLSTLNEFQAAFGGSKVQSEQTLNRDQTSRVSHLDNVPIGRDHAFDVLRQKIYAGLISGESADKVHVDKDRWTLSLIFDGSRELEDAPPENEDRWMFPRESPVQRLPLGANGGYDRVLPESPEKLDRSELRYSDHPSMLAVHESTGKGLQVSAASEYLQKDGSSVLDTTADYLDYHDYRRHREDREGWRIKVSVAVDQEQPRIQLTKQGSSDTARDPGKDRNDTRRAQRDGSSRGNCSRKKHVVRHSTGHPDLQQDQRHRRHTEHQNRRRGQELLSRLVERRNHVSRQQARAQTNEDRLRQSLLMLHPRMTVSGVEPPASPIFVPERS